ncbi:transposase family protein [Geodermatophilus sp. URMC 62]|uniref:transposase family protein n=1 Tax=Geodermatophilus sp. URMC 62 TaxID=3423414 RepID=UPI00406C74AE
MHGWPIGRGGGRSELAPGAGWCSSTGCWPPWCTCVIHHVLACLFGVSRSTITRAIGEVRPLLAERGCTVEAGSGCAPWPTWWPI